jgi:hypothetical protein
MFPHSNYRPHSLTLTPTPTPTLTLALAFDLTLAQVRPTTLVLAGDGSEVHFEQVGRRI